MIDLPALPVTAVLPDLLNALEAHNAAVLVAPPGAGKTTLVPLALLDAPWRSDGLILLLEPRRLAARAAARRMASLLGEEPGQTVGYAMRMESRRSAATRILVVTESILSRMILDDPELAGIACILFDEFHERSLDGDFGLALALDVQGALRPDLRLLVMSATIDGARVADLLGTAPVLQSEGRAFPVETRHIPRDPNERIEDAVARAVRDALATETGSILAFLPGQREIERTAERLDHLPETVDVMPLFGAMDGRAQDLAIRPPAPGRRKVVLATSIAETSITIDGVRVAIDSGLARVPRYEPSSGLTRLETVRVSRASADQRAGRAGRTEPGIAIRLWHQGQTAALQPFTTPEILEADLSGLVLDCAAFGVADPTALAFLDPPPAPALSEARALLVALDALDEAGRLTEAGAAMRKLALPVRLAHMVAEAARGGQAYAAAELAVLLTERGLGGNAIDLDARLQRFRSERSPRANAARQLAKRLASVATPSERSTQESAETGLLLLHAWPDRIAKARGETGRFLLANGRGATLEATERLARAAFLVVADLQGAAQNARIAAATEITEAEIRTVLADKIERSTQAQFDPERRAVRVRETERLGAITLSERLLPAPSGAQADAAILDALRTHGLDLLSWSDSAAALRQRLSWLHQGLGAPWPDVSDDALLEALDDWLLPFLTGKAAFAQIPSSSVSEGLRSLVPYDLQRQLDQLAPTHFAAPSGSHLPIRYDGEWPVLAVRVQELFGLTQHPSIAAGSVALTLELLSPAHRPIQTTRDLPGFWRGSWADVRADMRGRYPKHVWPEDPAAAQATSRAKPRGT